MTCSRGGAAGKGAKGLGKVAGRQRRRQPKQAHAHARFKNQNAHITIAHPLPGCDLNTHSTSFFFFEAEAGGAQRPWFFSWTFCVAACTIVSGCLAERTRLAVYPVGERIGGEGAPKGAGGDMRGCACKGGCFCAFFVYSSSTHQPNAAIPTDHHQQPTQPKQNKQNKHQQ